MPVLTSRRNLIAGAAALPLASLPACRSLPEPPGPACDPPAVSGVDWIPDAMHPVAFGEVDVSVAEGAPQPLTIWHPSPRFLPPSPMLRSCIARWPLVLLLHGQPPSGLPEALSAAYQKRFFAIGVSLARSGYVVAAPRHDAALPQASEAQAQVARQLENIAFVRSRWSEARFVSQRPGDTVIVGHSYGALLGARIVAANPAYGAFASLGGGFLELGDGRRLVESIPCPSLFMFSRADEPDTIFERIGDNPSPANNLWDRARQPTWAVIHAGRHFDYLEESQSGAAERGACSLLGGVAADLVTLFVAANIQSHTAIPVSLEKPAVTLTAAQQALAIQHLESLGRARRRPGCAIDLEWRVGNEKGSRRVAP